MSGGSPDTLCEACCTCFHPLKNHPIKWIISSPVSLAAASTAENILRLVFGLGEFIFRSPKVVNQARAMQGVISSSERNSSVFSLNHWKETY